MPKLHLVSGVGALRPIQGSIIYYDAKDKNRLVNRQGKPIKLSDQDKKFILIGKQERELANWELGGRRFIAVMLIICTLGVAYFSTCIQNLLNKTSVTTDRYMRPLGSADRSVLLQPRASSKGTPYTQLAEMPRRIGLYNEDTDCFLLSVLQLLAHIKPLQVPFRLAREGEKRLEHHFINEFLQRYSESRAPFSVAQLRRRHLAEVGLDRGQQDPTEAFTHIMNLPDLDYSAPIFHTLRKANGTLKPRQCFYPINLIPQTQEERRQKVNILEKGLAHYFAKQKLLTSPTHFTFTLVRHGNRQLFPLLIEDTRNRGRPIRLGQIDHRTHSGLALSQKIREILNGDNEITGYTLPDKRRLVSIIQKERHLYLWINSKGRAQEITACQFNSSLAHITAAPYSLNIKGRGQESYEIRDELEMDFTFRIPDDYVEKGGGGLFAIKAFIYRPYGSINSGHYAACIQDSNGRWQTFNDNTVKTISKDDARTLLRTKGYVFYSEKA